MGEMDLQARCAHISLMPYQVTYEGLEVNYFNYHVHKDARRKTNQ
jgi:hypothetical protein